MNFTTVLSRYGVHKGELIVVCTAIEIERPPLEGTRYIHRSSGGTKDLDGRDFRTGLGKSSTAKRSSRLIVRFKSVGTF